MEAAERARRPHHREIAMKKPSGPLALHLISLGIIAAMTLQPVRADCPQRVKIIVPYPPGNPDDLIARILAEKLSQVGGRFYVENMPGATGMIGAAAAARAAPDGCTLVIVNQNLVTQPAVGAKNPYSVPDDFTPITLLLAAPETISVNPSVPAKTLQELISLAKANPGKYNYASPGYGSSPHLAAERLFKRTLGLDIVHIPFQSGPPAINATVAGHTQILAITLPLIAPLVKEGKLRLLGIANKTRSPEFPDVLTLEEAGIPGHEVGFWDGILLPKGAASGLVEQLHRQITQVMTLPDVKERLATLGYTLINGSPEAFTALLKTELATWSAIARELHIKVDDDGLPTGIPMPARQ
jgi:tripartite-type tricarboxylate transporter receptor subunit TctC